MLYCAYTSSFASNEGYPTLVSRTTSCYITCRFSGLDIRSIAGAVGGVSLNKTEERMEADGSNLFYGIGG